MRQAAWPRIVGPAFNNVGVGFQPWAMRRSSNSSGKGLWSQTATAV